MIKIVIDKAHVKTDADKAAFSIVKAGLEKDFKKLEPEVKKEGGSVEVKVIGPGTYSVEMDGLSPRLRKKVASLIKRLSK
jgi:hypothetical protein